MEGGSVMHQFFLSRTPNLLRGRRERDPHGHAGQGQPGAGASQPPPLPQRWFRLQTPLLPSLLLRQMNRAGISHQHNAKL